jgi:hypothetical protein
VSVAFLLLIFAAVAGSATLVAFAAWLLVRINRIEGGPTSDARLLQTVEALRDELDGTQAALRDLNDRMEFTERLLRSGEARASDDESASLPPGGPSERGG